MSGTWRLGLLKADETMEQFDARMAEELRVEREEEKAHVKKMVASLGHPFYGLVDRVELHGEWRNESIYRIDLHPNDFFEWQRTANYRSMRDAVMDAEAREQEAADLFEKDETIDRMPRAACFNVWLCINRAAPRIEKA